MAGQGRGATAPSCPPLRTPMNKICLIQIDIQSYGFRIKTNPRIGYGQFQLVLTSTW